MSGLEKLALFFETFIQYEPEIEQARIFLVSDPLFEPYNAFKEIDSSLTGFITADDIYAYLHHKNVRAELRYVYSLVNHYSSHSGGKMFVTDFFKFVLPSTKTSLREDALRRNPGVMPEDLLKPFLRIFILEIEMWQKVDRIKYEIDVMNELDLTSAFQELDFPRSGFVTAKKIQRFLNKFGKDYEKALVYPVVARLDSDGDSALSLEEFLLALKVTKLRHFQPLAEIPEKPREKSVKTIKKNQKNHKLQKFSSNPNKSLQNLCSFILKLEASIEKEKKKLIVCPDFNLNAVLKLFDENNLQFSTESDFSDGLSNLNIKSGKEEITLLFKHYSKKYNKRLTHDELSLLFLPYLERKIFTKPCELHEDTIEKVKLLIEKHLDNEIAFERFRQLWKKEGIDLQKVFSCFRCEAIGFLELQQYCSTYRDVNEKEINWLLRYFKKSESECITFSDFSSEISPKSSKRF